MTINRPPSRETNIRRPARAIIAAAAATVGLLAVPVSVQVASAVPATPSTTSIAVGHSPWGVAVDSATATVYVTNEASDTVSVIDEASHTVTDTIPVGSDPQGVAVDPSTDTIYVTNFGAGSMSVINGSTDTVTATVSGIGNEPSSVAVDAATDTVYVGTYLSSTVAVVNGATNTIIATISIPGANIHSVTVDPATHTVYADAYNLNYVAVINADTDTVTGELTGLAGPDGVAIDTTSGYLYVAMNYFANRVAVFDNTGNVWNVVHPKHDPNLVAVDPTSDIVVASLQGSNAASKGSVAIINGHTDAVTEAVAVGKQPVGIDIDTNTSLVFVANVGSDTVTTFAD